MGWTCYYNKPHNVREEIASLCTNPAPDLQMYPLKIAVYGSTYYVAVSRLNSQGERYTFAAIILTRNDPDGDWCYKALDESAGPMDCDAPPSILKLLSDTSEPYALEWREKCRVNAAYRAKRRKIKPGQTIRLHNPVTLTSGAEIDTFKVFKHYRRTVFHNSACGFVSLDRYYLQPGFDIL